MTTQRSFGTHPDIPDRRDHSYVAPRQIHRALPTSVDLRHRCPPVYDQKHLNSCSANAIAAAFWFDELKQQEPDTRPPSRLFLYYNERATEHLVRHNAPVSLRDGYKSVARKGLCPERLWPYRQDRFARKPPLACYRAARQDRALTYQRVTRDLAQLRACLAEGYPFTLGLSVYESFKSETVAASGRVEMPRQHERLLGGHGVLAVGYRDSSQRFLVRNSWGRRWGMGGYFTLPYDYLLHASLAWDFWTLRRVT